MDHFTAKIPPLIRNRHAYVHNTLSTTHQLAQHVDLPGTLVDVLGSHLYDGGELLQAGRHVAAAAGAGAAGQATLPQHRAHAQVWSESHHGVTAMNRAVSGEY